MENKYDSSFNNANVLNNQLIFGRINGLEYPIHLSQLQDLSTLKSVELINNSLIFTKISGDIISVDLSSYNGFDNVSLNSTSKDLIFYNNGIEITKVNFDAIINNSFINGNPFVSIDIINNDMVFTMVNGATRTISIRSIQEQGVLNDINITSDIMTFSYLNGNIKQFDLKPYSNIDDISYDNMKLFFYKKGVFFKEIDIKPSILDIITQTVINELSTEISQRISGDILLSNSLSSEISQRTSNDVIISTEISQRIIYDLILSSELSTEISQSSSNNILLSNGLSTEISQRTSNDVLLSNGLSTEISQRTSNDVLLTNNLSTEISQRLKGNTTLTNNLSIEISQRTSNDVLLTSGLSTEISQRTSSDIILSISLSTEISQRTSGDIILSINLSTNLSNSLSTEISKRTASDKNLSTSISINSYKINDINSVLLTEIIISGQTSIRNNVSYLMNDNININNDITYLYNNKSNIGHTHTYSPSEFIKTLYRYDIIWENEWIKVEHTPTRNFNQTYKVSNLKVFANFGYGLIILNPIINYSSSLTNTLSSTESAFYISDADGIINKNSDFDYIYIEYDVLSDGKNKYDSKKYILGENVVNDHSPSDGYHSKSTGYSFNAAYIELDNIHFTGDNIESIYDPLIMGSLSSAFTPTFCSIRNANMVYRPYTNAAANENSGSNPNILSVGSHAGNYFQRVDITSSATIFLENSIAVVARPNNITQINRSDPYTQNFTSFGYGAEFLEVASNLKMNENYTRWTNPLAIGWGVIDETGLIITNQNNSTILNSFFNILEIEVGSRIGIGLSYPSSSYQIRTIVEILSDFTLRVDTPITPLEPGVNYIYIHDAHIGTIWGWKKYNDYPTNSDRFDRFFWQSPTTGLIAGKLKKIKMVTGVSWNMVREAARKTAYLYDNVTTLSTGVISGSQTDKLYVSNTNVFPEADSGYPNKVIGTVIFNNNIFYIKGKNTELSYIYGDIQSIKYTTNTNSQIKLFWDIYRGFGEIQVADAINYINENYKSETYKNILADKLEGERSINGLLDYKNLYPNSPISKKMVSDIATDIKFTTIDETASVDNLGKIRYFKNSNTSVAQMCMQIGENQYDWINITTVNSW